MNVVITGASGLIGTALTKKLSNEGHRIFPMVRDLSGDNPFQWHPQKNKIKWDKTIPIDVVVHLAGAGIAQGRWTKKRKQTILDSREKGTQLLSRTLAGLKHKPRVYISGSAIGYYGDTGDHAVDEESRRGDGFLAEVCQIWEAATVPATQAGIRTVNIRIGVVLSRQGGALQKMVLPFKLGLGGRLGSGRQYMSWVSLEELVHMVRFIMKTETISGPVNLVSENPVTNGEFSESLAKALNRPALFPVPAFMLKLVLGEMADELLLQGSKVIPRKLKSAGFDFYDADLQTALQKILK